jgi:hypothetical protein
MIFPVRETAVEGYKPGVTVITPADGAKDAILSVILSCRVNGETWSLVRVRLQGAAPLGGNLGDDRGSRRRRRITHPTMHSNPSRITLPRPSVSDEIGRVLPGWDAPRLTRSPWEPADVGEATGVWFTPIPCVVVLIDVALLVGLAPGDGVCMPVVVGEGWLVAVGEGWPVAVGVADFVEVGAGVAVRVTLGDGVGVNVVVTVGDGVVVVVGDGVSVSVSSNAT